MYKEKYDLAIAYRIYPKVSKIPAIYPDDKYKLSQICLKSFKDSLGSLKTRIWVLLDNCPPEYESLFRKYFNEGDLEFVRLDGIGNQATFEMQIKILSEQTDSDLVYFAEDDYFYLPDQFQEMILFMQEHEDVDFISPYDHLDYYTLGLHKHTNTVRISDKKHWRTASTTCLTFLTQKDVLVATKNIFNTYAKGSFDAALWLSITKRQLFRPITILGYFFKDKYLFEIIAQSWFYGWRQILFGKTFKLWIPIPSIGTHIETKFLSPTVDWLTLMNQTIDSEIVKEYPKSS